MTAHSYFGTQKFDFDGQSKDVYRIYLQSIPFFILFFVIFLYVAKFVALYVAELGGRWLPGRTEAIVTVTLMGLALLIVLAVPWSYLKTEQEKYFWNHTYFSAARFSSSVEFSSYFWLKLGNALLLLGSFGLAWPWVKVRNMQFVIQNLDLKGEFEPERIAQETQSASPVGDELADLLPFDTGFFSG
jgi:uncharacterized membrane protein YjgN (DUF898 family)